MTTTEMFLPNLNRWEMKLTVKKQEDEFDRESSGIGFTK